MKKYYIYDIESGFQVEVSKETREAYDKMINETFKSLKCGDKIIGKCYITSTIENNNNDFYKLWCND